MPRSRIRLVRPRRTTMKLQPGGLTLEQAVQQWEYALEARNCAPLTRHAYVRMVETFATFLRESGRVEPETDPLLSDLTVDNTRAFLSWLRATPVEYALTSSSRMRGSHTIRHYANVLKVFANALVREDILEYNPLARVTLPKAIKRVIMPYTQAEVQAMLKALEQPASRNRVRNRALFLFLLDTGVRAEEACGIALREDLDLVARRARILGKGNKERFVYFERETARAIQLYVAAKPRAWKRWLFVTENGDPLHGSTLYNQVRTWGEASGVANATTHRFRHTFAVSYLKVHPGDLFHLQVLLGHESLEMVRHYAKIAEGERILPGPSTVQLLGVGGGSRREEREIERETLRRARR
jgi:site-specific recombinase XerD